MKTKKGPSNHSTVANVSYVSVLHYSIQSIQSHWFATNQLLSSFFPVHQPSLLRQLGYLTRLCPPELTSPTTADS